VLPQRGGRSGESTDRRECNASAQRREQHLNDDRGLSKHLRAELAQAVGEDPEAGLGLVKRQHTQVITAERRTQNSGFTLLLPSATYEQDRIGAQVLEDIEYLGRILVADSLCRRPGTGEDKHHWDLLFTLKR